MSNYSKTTDFEAKDSLPTGDSGKIIRGAEFETEFDAISTAIGTKADTAGPTFTGTLTFETISDGTIGVTAFVDEDNMSSDSATLVPTQQSVKAYVDAQVTAQDLDFQADSGGALSIDLDSEALTFTGGTGVDTSGSGNAVTFAIDSTVATLTGTQTLTNKTLTSPDVNTPDIDGGTIDGTVIGGATPAAVSATTVSATGNITVGGTVDGRDVATDGTKLDGIEASATADQTAAEIRTLVESASDSNVFTDADHTKLNAIEASATADQTDAEIRAAVEAATDSNVFTDADHTKLNAIEASADVTDTANVTAAGALMDSELTSIASVKALNQGVATTDSPTFAGLTTTADVSFGDNDKAIFGAGSDLQIYHDGSNSYIENTAPFMLIESGTVVLRNTAGTEDYAKFNENSDVKLYFDNSQKFATTSTGIDVTGTVTADGLDSSGALVLGVAGSTNGFINTGESLYINIDSNNDQADSRVFQVAKNSTDGSGGKILLASEGGDISFYEDTGTSPKMVWKSADERLGVGNASPTRDLTVGDTAVSSYINIKSSATNGISGLGFGDSGDDNRAQIVFDNSTDKLQIQNGGGGALGNRGITLDSSENVGIGTSSPATNRSLHVSSAPQNQARFERTGASTVQIEFQDSTTTNQPSLGGDGDSLTFRTSFTERMRIDSSGDVGIGVTSPDATLTVSSGSANNVANFKSTDGTAYIAIADNSSTSALHNQIGVIGDNMYFATNDTERMRIDSAGRVGIGASDPSSGTSTYYDDLVIKNDTSGTGAGITIQSNSTNGYGAVEFRKADGTQVGKMYASSADGQLAFETAGSERMRIDSSGNLLVGTTDANPTNNNTNSAADRGIAFSGGQGWIANTTYNETTAYFNRTGTDGTIIELIKSGSPVGSIGTNSGLFIGSTYGNDAGIRFASDIIAPSTTTGANRDAAIDLGYDSSRFKDLYLSGTAYVGGVYNTGIYNQQSGDIQFWVPNVGEAVRIQQNTGNLLVGTTATPSKAGLAVGSTTTGKNISVFSSSNGNNGIISIYQSSGAEEGQLYAGAGNINFFGTSTVKVVASTNGVQLTSGATSWTAISDERSKDIIEPITNAVQKVSTLRSVIGKYKTDAEESRRAFLIAQDVQAVLPEAVDATNENELGIKYTETIPLLVAAIKEQTEIINDLRARVAQLEGAN